MKKSSIYALALLSGFLLSLPWLWPFLWPIIFVAWVPLLFIEYFFSSPTRSSFHFWVATYLSFFVWNVLSTWWIKNASLGGAAMAIVCNALLMTIVFLLFHQFKKKWRYKGAFSILVFFWLSFEYFHFNWDLNWPWLTLGNVFAFCTPAIQWYEFTGVLGGSFWILVVNILVFFCLKLLFVQASDSTYFNKKKLALTLSLVLLFPFVVSLMIRFLNVEEKSNPTQILIVQPNIDPYNTKFNLSNEQQLQAMLLQAKYFLDSTTDYLLLPETALPATIDEKGILQSPSIICAKKFLLNFPQLKIIIGATTSKEFTIGEELSETARQYDNDETYYDIFNTALQIDTSNQISIYHKSKLVPGVEKMPFPWLMNVFEKFAIDLGGTSGSLGFQTKRSVFYSANKKQCIAPVICYESVFGEFVGNYISNGAQLIAIITNDGWWGNTPGYKQHLRYATLRAIETRKWIARCANTGTSAFINSKGDILQTTPWWKKAILKQEVYLNSQQTFYTRNGDYIGRMAVLLSSLVLLISFSIRIKRRLTKTV
jgi:apolipoprotein N-acyltransferase